MTTSPLSKALHSGWPDRIESLFLESIQAKQSFLRESISQILTCGEWMTEVLQSGKKILIFGNGGSSTDAMHIAGELVSRFYKERRGLPAIALGTNMATLTSISNDYSYENVFSREVEAYGEAGDLAIGISTSGNSRNVLKGIEKAKERGLKTVALTGGTGGQIRTLADLSLVVPSKLTPRIQECHITVGHILCELVEEALFVS